MDYESSDILGGRTLPIVRGSDSGHWSDSSFLVKTASILGLLSIVYVIFTRAWDRFLRWQEASYKLSMRRRHGIPDTDHRPFNVAYAAVTRARQNREAKERVKTLPKPDQRPPAPVDAQIIRQRFSDAGASRKMVGAWSNSNYVDANSGAEASAARSYPTPSPTDALNFAARYNPKPPSTRIPESALQSRFTVPARHLPRRLIPALDITRDDRRKRVLDEEDDLEPVKKTRVEVEEVTDEEDTERDRGRNAGDAGAKRGSKRVLGEEDDEATESKQARDKRARKVLRVQTPEDHIMVEDGSDGDEPTELVSVSRGRKRDRAEAGSTFGGDDGELHGEEDEDNGKNSRRRKRRSVLKRKSDAHSRGQKRDRDAQSHGSDSEAEESRVKKRTSRKRKGKNEGKDGSASDVSMADSQVSQDPLCKGRRIGEEWEANGVLWRVGTNGDRLRQALVKKARSKFVMPKDSQHPDREANLEVFIETWLTDDQYKEAQDRHELAWQDSPKPLVEPETPGNVPDSPTKSGKNLLWESTMPKDSTTPKRGPYRQSIATNLGIRVNPFQLSQYAPSRRVVSSYASPFPGAADASSPRHRTFSKWEKQDLEAQAMAIMRAKAQEEKAKQQEAKAKEIAAATSMVKKSSETGGLTASTLAPSCTTPAPSLSAPVPSFATPALNFSIPTPASAPPASFQAPVEKPAQPPIFGVAPVSTNGIKATEPSKPTPVPSEAPLFTLPTAKSDTPQPLFTLPTAKSDAPQALFTLPVAQNNTTKSNSPPIASTPSNLFSFGAPLARQQPTPPSNNTMATLNVPSGSATRPSSPAAAPSQAAPTPQHDAAPKTPFFSFAPPGSGPSPQFSLGAQSAKGPVSAFGSNEPSKKPEPKLEQKPGDGGPLMLRIGGFGGPQSSQPAAPSTFSFQKPTAPTAGGDPIKPSSVFGGSSTPQGTPPASQATSGTAPTTVKFHFGATPTPSNPVPATSSTQTLSGGAGSSGSSSAPFTFGTSSMPKPEPTGKFAPQAPFLTSSSSLSGALGPSTSTEGAKNAASSPSAPSSQDAAKSAFGGFTGSGFSAASGAPPLTNFGGGGSVFGGSGTTPAQSNQSNAFGFPKGASMFGNPPASNASGTANPFNPTSSEPSKQPQFFFGQPSNPTNNSQPSSVGAQPSANTSSAPTPAPAPAPTSSTFGFSSTPAFTFGQKQQ